MLLAAVMLLPHNTYVCAVRAKLGQGEDDEMDHRALREYIARAAQLALDILAQPE